MEDFHQKHLFQFVGVLFLVLIVKVNGALCKRSIEFLWGSASGKILTLLNGPQFAWMKDMKNLELDVSALRRQGSSSN